MTKLLALLLLVGCAESPSKAPSCEGRYHFDASFPEAWKPSVRDAVSRWNLYTPTILIETDKDPACAFKSTDAPMSHNVEGLTFTTHEICTKVLGLNCITYEAMHAIGHQMGLCHISDVGVMNPTYIIPVITDADIIECKRVGGCSQP